MKSLEKFAPRLVNEVKLHLGAVYPSLDLDDLAQKVLNAFWPEEQQPLEDRRIADNSLWDQTDAYVITYGNSIINGENKPLDLLWDFLKNHLNDVMTGVHILPYFPYTSDDGFAITDYYAVDSKLGAWEDIGRISTNFRFMSDLVINHCSSQSVFFNKYLAGNEPYDGFFFEASPDDDLSLVVRPRAHDLLREVQTANGTKHVWCTFSHDQVDFDFSNPEVLLEFIRILRFHMDKGVRTLRLDAIAFLWKEVGTKSIHMNETHEVVRLFRTLSDHNDVSLILITETNVPNFENLSYFGNRNEAHVVYNFTLPPLLLHALLNGTSEHLSAWQMTMPPAQLGCAYFNFTASHDGVGVRGAEGFLSNDDVDSMIETTSKFGGLVSMRQMPDGTQRPYEINISLFDAMKGTVEGEDEHQINRFLCGQTIALGLEGIPGIYIHSLLATPNNHDGVGRSKHNRTINRHRWHYPELLEKLADHGSNHAIVLSRMKELLRIRSSQDAFHPNATQFTLQLGHEFFGFWRQSMDRSQSIFAVHNLTKNKVSVPAMSLNLIGGERWYDLIAQEILSATTQMREAEIEFQPYQCRWITNQLPDNET